MDIYFYTIVLLIILKLILNSTKQSVRKSNKKERPTFTKLVYTDTNNKKYDSVMLKSTKHMLRGKPDLVYKSLFTRKYYPIELKSGSLGSNATFPRDGDLMQLCAYFFMLEEHYSCKVPYGKLVYNDCAFIVKNNKYMRKTFLTILSDMRTFDISKTSCTVNKKICSTCSLKHTVCKYKA